MDKKKEVSLSAVEAKLISETTAKPLARIYKAIKEEAEEGRSILFWSVCGFNEKLLKNIIAELKAKGYVVKSTYTKNASQTAISDITIIW